MGHAGEVAPHVLRQLLDVRLEKHLAAWVQVLGQEIDEGGVHDASLAVLDLEMGVGELDADALNVHLMTIERLQQVLEVDIGVRWQEVRVADLSMLLAPNAQVNHRTADFESQEVSVAMSSSHVHHPAALGATDIQNHRELRIGIYFLEPVAGQNKWLLVGGS